MSHKQLTFSAERTELEARLKNLKRERFPLAVFLDGVQDIRNIGSIFRICDGLRLQHLYIHDFHQKWQEKKMRRYSRSTIEYVDFTVTNSIDQCKEIFSKYECIALEKTDKSIYVHDCTLSLPSLLIIGNERDGVSDWILSSVDSAVHLPMMGINTSINVSNAASAALFSLYFNHS